MSKVKYEIPGIVGLVCIILSSGQIKQTSVRVSLSLVCVIGAIILSYFVIREFETIIKKSIDSRDRATKESMETLKNAIEKYNEEQHRFNEGNEKIKTMIIENYSEEKMLFEKSMKQFKETMEGLNNTIEKYNEGQYAKMEQMNSLIGEFNTATTEYSRRVDSLAEIQTEIIKEQHRLNEGNEKIKTVIVDHYSKEKMLLEESIEQYKETSIENANKQLETINNSFEYVNNILKEIEKCMLQELDAFKEKYTEITERTISEEKKYLAKINSSIEKHLTNYGNTLNGSSETLQVLKATVQTNLDAIKAMVGKQASDVNDGLEDCSDALNDGLDKFSKQQKARDEEQNNKLNERLGTIEKVISKQVGAVLEENKKLLSYMQNIQEEWTSLSRDEIDFLSKVWDE